MKEHYRVSVCNEPMFPRKYVVCRLVRGELWYYGSWDDKEKADACAKEFENGLVVETCEK